MYIVMMSNKRIRARTSRCIQCRAVSCVRYLALRFGVRTAFNAIISLLPINNVTS